MVGECNEDLLFFKQKTAYERLRSLVGSEMCIRDRQRTDRGVVKITYPAITYKVRRSQAQHRDVSAPSFRGGAIRSLEG